MGRLIDKDSVFERLALPHRDAVFHFSLSMTRDETRAEDLVQDTYLQAYRKFELFELGTNCKAWLFRICKNLFIDNFRARRRRPPHHTIGAIEPAVRDPDRAIAAYTARGIEDEAIFLDLFGDEVNRFLRELPEEFKEALLLCDIEGLAYQEISDTLDIPIGTVRSRISRARSFLRERLEDYAGELGYKTEVTSDGRIEDDE